MNETELPATTCTDTTTPRSQPTITSTHDATTTTHDHAHTGRNMKRFQNAQRKDPLAFCMLHKRYITSLLSRHTMKANTRTARCMGRRRRRAFIQSEEVRPTRCRVAPTRANPLDWRRPPPHESCSTMARPIPLPSRLCCHALKFAREIDNSIRDLGEGRVQRGDVTGCDG